jgi:prevent-host-death family protein
MCYMSETERPPARVGVRELRQNLSVYLDRVKAGETLEVTEYGQPVAQLGPRPKPPVSILDQMIADGRATPATILPSDIPPPPKVDDPSGKTLTEILLDMRDEERW